MKHLFVSCELALLAKEKGFDEQCLAYYKDQKDYYLVSNLMYESDIDPFDTPEHQVSAPLYQQLVDWFREKEIYITIECDYDKSAGYNRGFTPVVNGTYHFYDGDCFIEYYNALSIALTEAFKLINH